MIVVMRNNFEEHAKALSPGIGSGVHNMRALERYRVLFMWCGPRSNTVFLYWGGPFPDGIDVRLCEIVDPSIEPAWGVRTHRHSNGEELLLLGPEFWVDDYDWYRLLLDNDAKAGRQYAEYVSDSQGPER